MCTRLQVLFRCRALLVVAWSALLPTVLVSFGTDPWGGDGIVWSARLTWDLSRLFLGL